MLHLANGLVIPSSEIEISAVRAQGAGGQNVNKVATAIHLRFDVQASSLPDLYKERLLRRQGRFMSKEGVIIIKAQRYRSQDKNREDALNRLRELIQHAMVTRKKRKSSRPSKAAREKRLEAKAKRGQQKALRTRIEDE